MNKVSNSDLKEAADRLEYYDYYFSYLNLTTIQIIEGLTSAIAFGVIFGKAQTYIKLSETQTSILAFLISWYIQKLIIDFANEISMFKKKSQDKKFIESKGSEFVQDLYYQQDIVHPDPPEDIYQIVKE